MGHIPEAMERYELAVDLDAGNTEITMAATDGIRSLDAIQLRQVAALAAADQAFRIGLARDARDALETRGFVLSDEGLAILSNIDLDVIARDARGGGYDIH
jgi:hypothetical protein